MPTKFRQKISKNGTNFNSVQKIEGFFRCIVGYTELVNSNMLPEFSREQRELPCQPNSGKKNKIATTSVLCKKSRNFSHE